MQCILHCSVCWSAGQDTWWELHTRGWRRLQNRTGIINQWLVASDNVLLHMTHDDYVITWSLFHIMLTLYSCDLWITPASHDLHLHHMLLDIWPLHHIYGVIFRLEDCGCLKQGKNILYCGYFDISYFVKLVGILCCCQETSITLSPV